MATLASEARPANDNGFFAGMTIVMALVVIAGFSTQFLAGRSTFQSPPIVHAHAAIFMGWIVLFVTQSMLITRGSPRLHRKIGWVAAGWTAAMVIAGIAMTVRDARVGHTPFFFTPQSFLILNPVTVLTFAGLIWVALRQRRYTGWHRRLIICAMTSIMGPGFGRLLPLPLMMPYAFEIAWVAGLVFPIAGMVYDKRRNGRVHPAWYAGVAVLLITFAAGEAIVVSPLGDALYRFATAGSPGASVPGLAFPPPPA